MLLIDISLLSAQLKRYLLKQVSVMKPLPLSSASSLTQSVSFTTCYHELVFILFMSVWDFTFMSYWISMSYWINTSLLSNNNDDANSDIYI